MPSDFPHHNVIVVVIHWVLAAVILALLGLGWYLITIPPAHKEELDFLIALHTSLGFTAGILLFIQILLRIVLRPPPYPQSLPRWQKALGYTSYILIYAALFVLLGSGYLQASLGQMPVQFWGIFVPAPHANGRSLAEILGPFWGAPVLIWGNPETSPAQFFGAIHGKTAFALAALVILHAGFIISNLFRYPGLASRMLLVGAQPDEPAPPSSRGELQVARTLSKNLRFFGWIGFWILLVLTITAGVLLEFASSGRAFSHGALVFGDAIYWGDAGFLLLCIAVVLAFCYTRAARKITLKPAAYLGTESNAGKFWFLAAGILVGFLGLAISFGGIVVSLLLLVAKTLSQPPGIAITDPTRIVRALDVFVLIVNFNLLIAHAIGVGLSVSLSYAAMRSRRKYTAMPRQQI